VAPAPQLEAVMRKYSVSIVDFFIMVEKNYLV
jgi:hypothetical protein